MCAGIVVMCMMASVRKHWWYYVMAPLAAEAPGVLTVVMVVCLSGYAICTFGCEYMYTAMQSCGCLSVQHTTETVHIWLPHNGMGSITCTVSDLKPSAAQNHLPSSTVDSIPFCHCSGSAIAEHFTALIQILMSAGSMPCTSQWLASSTQTNQQSVNG